MTHYSNRRFGSDNRSNLLAGLNFNLPRVPKSPVPTKHHGEVSLIFRLKGKKRGADRYVLDMSRMYRRLNPDPGNLQWKPHCAAIGNDSAKRLFLILDHDKEIPESVEITYTKKDDRCTLNSKAAVMKVLICMPEVQKPQIADSGLVIEFDVRMMNGDDTMWELIPKVQIQEFADEKLTPKVIPFKS